MSGVESIPGLVFTGLKVILAAAAVYFVLHRAVAALTLHALYWKGLDCIELDWIGGERSGVDWFNVHPVACRSPCLCPLELNADAQDQLPLLNCGSVCLIGRTKMN